MYIWQAITLAVSSNLDDLGVSFSVGLKEPVPTSSALVISVMSGITMALGLLIGEMIAGLVPGRTAPYLAAGIFTLLAVWFLLRSRQDPSARSSLQPRESLLLGAGLGADSIVFGFSGGLGGYPLVLTSVLALLSSLAFVVGGSLLAGRVGTPTIRERADHIAAALLLLLAVAEILTK